MTGYGMKYSKVKKKIYLNLFSTLIQHGTVLAQGAGLDSSPSPLRIASIRNNSRCYSSLLVGSCGGGRW